MTYTNMNGGVKFGKFWWFLNTPPTSYSKQISLH